MAKFNPIQNLRGRTGQKHPIRRGTATRVVREFTPQTFIEYGLKWNEADPIAREMHMVRLGGVYRCPRNNKEYGNGVDFHFKRLMQLMWPDIVWHSWIDLIVTNYLAYRVVVVIGPASTGKTLCAALCVLLDWMCFPDTTTVICCSTTRERLEDRVWGEIKKRFRMAREKCDWIQGSLIEGRQRIIADEKEESLEGRDFRNGLCFPSGSLVDTPSGPKPIETIKKGDLVFNAIGIGMVSQTFHSFAASLVRIRLSDGRHIDCTEEHLILTDRGWRKAIDLETSDMVFSSDETMSLLRSGNSQQRNLLLSEMRRTEAVWRLRKSYRVGLSQPQVLLRSMPGLSASQKMRPVRSLISARKKKTGLEKRKDWQIQGSILQYRLRRSMGVRPQGMLPKDKQAVPAMWKDDVQRAFFQSILFFGMPQSAQGDCLPKMRPELRVQKGEAKIAELEILLSGVSVGNRRANCSIEGLPPIQFGISSGQSVYRPSFPWGETSGRSGWRKSPNCWNEEMRCSENQVPGFARVESIEILEPSGDPRFAKSEGGYPVHNIAVEGHPSYSVNGVIVHNCGVPCKKGESYIGLGDFAGLKNKRVRLLGDELSLLPRVFVDAISNLDKNPDFKCIGLGNPKETTDALGVLGEPAAHLGGWDGGIDQAPGTKTWEIRRAQGIAIQLPGDDSPNLDGKLGIPLITQEQIDRDVSFYGKDSLWYTMMDLGRMPRGQGSRRVITRQFCLKHRAMDEPNWANSNRTKIAFLDAAYRGVGGDRCVFGELQFGAEAPTTPQPGNEIAQAIITQRSDSAGAKQILALIDTVLVPIRATLSEQNKAKPVEEVEDQITLWCMGQCQQRGIPPQNFFFDAGMRTALVSSMCRLWSNAVNPIDFGGRPSDRMVSGGIDIACCDYYSKFVTELWFSVRLIIEAEQFRGMTEGVMLEGCSREWKMVGANKTEVETKAEMKLKTGRSPDEFDALVCGVEGARRLGFRIARIESPKQKREDTRWKKELKRAAEEFWKSGSLSYSR